MYQIQLTKKESLHASLDKSRRYYEGEEIYITFDEMLAHRLVVGLKAVGVQRGLGRERILGAPFITTRYLGWQVVLKISSCNRPLATHSEKMFPDSTSWNV